MFVSFSIYNNLPSFYDNKDVESIFSEWSEKNDHTSFILADSTDSEPNEIYVISAIQEINHIRPKLTRPFVKNLVLPSKFHKSVSVIGFLNIGAQRSMLNFSILPPNYWESHIEYFRAANGKIFETSLITKKNPLVSSSFQTVSFGKKLMVQIYQTKIFF